MHTTASGFGFIPFLFYFLFFSFSLTVFFLRGNGRVGRGFLSVLVDGIDIK